MYYSEKILDIFDTGTMGHGHGQGHMDVDVDMGRWTGTGTHGRGRGHGQDRHYILFFDILSHSTF